METTGRHESLAVRLGRLAVGAAACVLLLAGCAEEEGCTAYVACPDVGAASEAFQASVDQFWEALGASEFSALDEALWQAWLPAPFSDDPQDGGFSQSALVYDFEDSPAPRVRFDAGTGRVDALTVVDEGEQGSDVVALAIGRVEPEQLALPPFERLNEWTFVSAGSDAVAYLADRRDEDEGGAWLADGWWAWNAGGGRPFRVGAFVAGAGLNYAAPDAQWVTENLSGEWLVGVSTGLHVWRGTRHGRVEGGVERFEGEMSLAPRAAGGVVTLDGDLLSIRVAGEPLASFRSADGEGVASVLDDGLAGVHFYSSTAAGEGVFRGLSAASFDDGLVAVRRGAGIGDAGVWQGGFLALGREFLSATPHPVAVATYGVSYLAERTDGGGGRVRGVLLGSFVVGVFR